MRSLSRVAADAGVCVRTVENWVRVGVGCPGGVRVRLAALKVGGRWKVSPAAWEEFLVALNPVPAPRPSSAADRDRETAAARKYIRQFGGRKKA